MSRMRLGKYFVISAVQGCGFPFLARPLFDYLVQGHYRGITVPVADIPDGILRFIIEKVSSLKVTYYVSEFDHDH